jgi:metal-responsive CopG/Arc/MetJ family transcriptional regulator
MTKRFELLLDEADLRELERIAFEAKTTRSHLVRKAVRLYLQNRKPVARPEAWEPVGQ